MTGTNSSRHSTAVPALASASVLLLAMLRAQGQVATVPTMDPDVLEAALGGNAGLTITSITIKNGVRGQFGTFSNFTLPPVTIRSGVVLSSGNVTSMGPFPEALDPNYDPASPPAVINSLMNTDPITRGGTPEFDAYGFGAGNIENFEGGYDVAALEVTFTLAVASPVKFDFIFGSVEYPFYTGQYTDAFLVFLDGTDPVNQITVDANHNAVQVGSSFAGLETTWDVNTAFSRPHGLIHHLTTTTAELDAGPHTLTFEVGDVNDQALDSAAFITHLRAEAGGEGTDPSEDACTNDFNGDGDVGTDADIEAFFACLAGNCCHSCASADFNDDGDTGTDQDIESFFRILAGGPC